MRMIWHRAKVRQLISVVGGVKEAAHILGVCERQVYRYQTGEQHLTGPQIVTLESAAMEPVYSACMAALVQTVQASSDDPLVFAAGAAREAAALPALIIAAQADGRISQTERRALLETIAAARSELDSAERALCASPPFAWAAS